MNIKDLQVGDYVGLHPATDLWMMGAKFGTVTKIGRKYITVRFGAWKTARVRPENIVSYSR